MARDVHMHAHINKCSVKHGLMPVKDPNGELLFYFFILFLWSALCFIFRGVSDVRKHDH